MTSERPTSSVVLPPWECPECGFKNLHTVTRCQARRFDPATANQVPALPAGVKLADHLKNLGLAELPRVDVVWRCTYVRPCQLCEKPGHPHSDGRVRCDDHPLQEANTWSQRRQT